MNIRIFWVHVMECMCAQARPQLILSSKRVLGGMGWTHVNSKEKIPSTRGSDWVRGGCIMQDSEPNTLPTELFRPRSYYENTDLHWQAVADQSKLNFYYLLCQIFLISFSKAFKNTAMTCENAANLYWRWLHGVCVLSQCVRMYSK